MKADPEPHEMGFSGHPSWPLVPQRTRSIRSRAENKNTPHDASVAQPRGRALSNSPLTSRRARTIPDALALVALGARDSHAEPRFEPPPSPFAPAGLVGGYIP